MNINRRRKLGMSLLPMVALTAILAVLLLAVATFKTSVSQEELAKRKMAATSAVNMAAAELRTTGTLQPTKSVVVDGVEVQLKTALSPDGNTMKISADGQGEVVQATAVRDVAVAPSVAPVVNTPVASPGTPTKLGEGTVAVDKTKLSALPPGYLPTATDSGVNPSGGMAGAAPQKLLPTATAGNAGNAPQVFYASNAGNAPQGVYASNAGNIGAAGNAGNAPQVYYASNAGNAPQGVYASNAGNIGNAGNAGNAPQVAYATNSGNLSPSAQPVQAGWTVYNADNVIISKTAPNRDALLNPGVKAPAPTVDPAGLLPGQVIGNTPTKVAPPATEGPALSPSATDSSVANLAAQAQAIKSGAVKLNAPAGTKMGAGGMLSPAANASNR